jgi:hypothetical protein
LDVCPERERFLAFREINSLVVNENFALAGGDPESTASGRAELQTSFELEVPTETRCASFERSHSRATRRTSAALPEPALRMPETCVLSSVGKPVPTIHIIRGEK